MSNVLSIYLILKRYRFKVSILKISIDQLKIASSLYTPFTRSNLSLRLFFQIKFSKSAVLAAFSVPIFAYNWCKLRL
jgi:hypothetical protein